MRNVTDIVLAKTLFQFAGTEMTHHIHFSKIRAKDCKKNLIIHKLIYSLFLELYFMDDS